MPGPRVASILVGFFFALASLPNGSLARAQDSVEFSIPELLSKVDAAASEGLKTSRLPGGAVVLVHKGKTVFKKGYGLANVANEQPVDPDETLFRIGSISKALTLLTLSRMIDAGKLELGEDVAKYVDGIQNPYSIESPVTVESLLTHTTGFDQVGGQQRQIRNFDWTLADRKAARPGLGEFLSSNMLRRINPPGERHRYDTYGTTLAGHILAQLTEQSYSEAMHGEMFLPLGMTNSFVEVPTENFGRLATGYETVDGQFQPQAYEVYVTTPASSIDATPADMGRLLEALTHGGANEHGRLFSEEMANSVLSPQFRPHPEFLGTTHGLHEAFADRNFERPLSMLEHGGTMQGYGTFMVVIPQYDLGVFVAVNHSGGRAPHLADAVMTAVASSLPVPGREPFEVPTRDEELDLSEYVGDYYYGVYCHTMTPEDMATGAWPRGRAHSFAQQAGALTLGERTYIPRGEDVFVRLDGRQMIHFSRREDGAVVSFSYSTSRDTFDRDLPDRPYVQIESMAQAMLDIANDQGVEAALKHFRENRESDRFYVSEDELNRVGYYLMGDERVDQALEIFKLNVELSPESWNAYDSLGEAYLQLGEESQALVNYKKSIELNPDNEAAKAVVEGLQQ